MNQAETSSNLFKIIFKNTFMITLGSVMLRVINFLFRVYIVRSLGDERFGNYSTVIAFVGLFQIFAELGITQFLMRETARNRLKQNELFWNVIVLRILLAIPAFFYIGYLASLADFSADLRLGVTLFTLTFILAAIDSPIEAILTAKEHLNYVTLKNVASQVTFVILGSIFMLLKFEYVWLIVAGLIAQIPQIGVGIWAILRHGYLPKPIHISSRVWPFILRSGLPFGIITLSLSIAYNIDTVILQLFHPAEVVGWYNVAYHLIFSLMSLTTGLGTAMVPSLSRVFVNDPVEVDRWYFRTVKMILILAIPTAVGGMLIADSLIPFLYTTEFSPAAGALKILVWDIPFVMFAGFCGNITTIVGLEKSAARIFATNAIVNIILNLVFIPQYGIIGASIVTVVTDIVSALQFMLLLNKRLHLPQMRGIILKTTLAAGLMGGLVWLTSQLNLFVMIAVGIITYSTLTFVFRLLDESELSFLRRILNRLRKRNA